MNCFLIYFIDRSTEQSNHRKNIQRHYEKKCNDRKIEVQEKRNQCT